MGRGRVVRTRPSRHGWPSLSCGPPHHVQGEHSPHQCSSHASPPVQAPKKTPIWKRAWFVGIIAFIFGIAVGAGTSGGDATAEPAPETTVTITADAEPGATVTVTQTAEAPLAAAEPAPEPAAPAETADAEEPDDGVSAEFTAALRQAELYIDTLPFSKVGLFDQLTSEHGGQFPDDAGQYAVDNVDADWNAEALEAAISYRDLMGMSNAAIHDQLTSQHGNKFTTEEADYAIANLPS